MPLSKTLPVIRNFIRNRPLLLNSVIYGTFYTTAELAQQTYNKSLKVKQSSKFIYGSEGSNSSTEYDWPRLTRYAIYGCFVAGPLLHQWYKWLDARYKGKATKIILQKLIADQFVLTPVLLVLFFVGMSFMEGEADVLNECKTKFLKTFQTSCVYWLPVQFVNFILVPPSLRVTFVSVAAFCWANILCYLKNMSFPTDKETNSNAK